MGRFNSTLEPKKTSGGRFAQIKDRLETPQQASVVEPRQPGFISRTLDSFKGVAEGEVKISDVSKELIPSAKKIGGSFADTFIPAIKNFVNTTGSIFGEGLAYAIDPEVRKQFTSPGTEGTDKITDLILEKRAKGEDVSRLVNQLKVAQETEIPNNLDILPVVSETTQADLARATIAAGIETAVYRLMPNTAKLPIKQRFGAGALQGMGFAISEGLAHDKSPEEIVKSMPQYGVFGGAIEILAPYLLPLLKAEGRKIPQEFKNMIRGLKEEIRPPKPRKLGVTSEFAEATRIPVRTPNTEYEAYLRSQGYEPYVPDDALPEIQLGSKARSTADNLPVIQAGDEVTPPHRVRGDVEFVPEKSVSGPQLEPKKEVIGTELEPRQVDIQVDEVIPETRTTRVPREQLPVSSEGGAMRVSRLEARIKGVVNDVNASRAESEGISTFGQMNKAEMRVKSAKFVDETPDNEIMAILKGEKPVPEGHLFNSIALAMEKKAELAADGNLAAKLASLRSTRAGQEISFLTEIEPDNPISAIQEIIKARAGRAQRTLKGQDVTKATRAEAVKAGAEVSAKRLKIEEAESLLNKLLC